MSLSVLVFHNLYYFLYIFERWYILREPHKELEHLCSMIMEYINHARSIKKICFQVLRDRIDRGLGDRVRTIRTSQPHIAPKPAQGAVQVRAPGGYGGSGKGR